MKSHYSETNFFTDGNRKIDFILVHKKILSEWETLQINRYLDNLKRKGVDIEKENGIRTKELIFVKLHAPDNLLLDLADVHNVILTFQKDNTRPKYNKSFNLLRNDVVRKPNNQNPLFQRSTQTVRGTPEETITSAERILLMNYLLTYTHFGFLKGEYGIRKMVKRKILVDAYPLHDGDCEWSEDGLLNDRQILGKYWANARSWNKIQPIHIIQKYYGQEVAFYFAWTGFYTIMLIPVSVLGFISFLYGVMTLGWMDIERIDEICKSEQAMCPRCMWEHCGFRILKDFCNLTKLTYIFDNWTTVTFAIIMSFWATCFIEMWKRKEVNYLYKWNLLSVDPEMDVMPEFEDQTPYTRISPTTGIMEYYIPTRIKVLHYTISVVCCLLMIILVLCTVIVMIYIRLYVQYHLIRNRYKFLYENLTLALLTFSSILSVVVIKLYKPYIVKLSMKLTKNENQRTQLQHNNSYIFKSYLLACVNNYIPLLYLTIGKEKLFVHPGHRSQYTQWFGFRADVCHPSGCLVGLTIQVTFLMIIKSFTGKILAFINPIIKSWMRKMRRKYVDKKKIIEDVHLPQWEVDYALAPFNDFALIGDFTELVLQYGLVTFFVAAMPLAPLFALLNNVTEVRLDAHKYLRRMRRPVPRRFLGLGAWNGILMAKTYFSTFCNALVITFTSEMVPRELYKIRSGDLKGFINSTISKFLVDDFDADIRDRLKKRFRNISVCFYRGDRYPMGHQQKYALNEEHFMELAIRFCVIVAFEHIIFFLTYILAFAIPDMPFWIKARLTEEEQQLKNERLKRMGEEYLKDRRKKNLK